MAWNDADQVRCNFDLVCPMQWDELDETDSADRRHCRRCDRDVHRIRDPEGLAAAQLAGKCIAIESLPRPPSGASPVPEGYPMHPPMMTLGMVAGPPRPSPLPRAWVPGGAPVAVIAVAVVAAAAALLWWWL